MKGGLDGAARKEVASSTYSHLRGAVLEFAKIISEAKRGFRNKNFSLLALGRENLVGPEENNFQFIALETHRILISDIH